MVEHYIAHNTEKSGRPLKFLNLGLEDPRFGRDGEGSENWNPLNEVE